MVDSIDDASKGASALNGLLTTLDKEIVSLIGAISNFGSTAKGVFGDTGDAAKGAGGGIGEFGGKLKDLEKAGVEVSKFFMGFDEFKTFAASAKDSFQSVGDSAQKLGPLLDKMVPSAFKNRIVDALESLGSGFVNAAAQGQAAEAGLYGMYAASGQLDKAFDSNGRGLDGLMSKTSIFEGNMEDLADATNQSVEKTIEFASSLGKIPGIMDSVVNAGGETAEGVDSFTAAMRLATATSQTAQEVVAEFTKAQTELSDVMGDTRNSAQKATEFISTMSEVSKGANLQFSDSKLFLEGVADQFKYVGDNTSAAARVMVGFSQALQETGLTAKASSDIVKGMVDDVKKLSVGTEAFLSLRTGGKGGLQGAFQFEELLRQGKLDEVMNKMQQAFRQQAGGHIYSLKEASQSPQAAAQFEKQRLLLQSGVFGIGKGADNDQATKILEALQKGSVNMFKDATGKSVVKTGQEAASDITAKGLALQTETNSELNKATRYAERNAIYGELTAAATTKIAFGTDVNAKFAEGIHAEMQNASASLMEAAHAGGNVREGTRGNQTENLKRVSPDVDRINSIIGDIASGIPEAVGDALKPGGPTPAETPPGIMTPEQKLKHQQDLDKRLGHQVPLNRPSPNTAFAINARPGADHAARLAGQAQTVAEHNKQEKANMAKDVKLKIEVVAPPGFGVNTTTPDRNVDIAKAINATTYGGGPHG